MDGLLYSKQLHNEQRKERLGVYVSIAAVEVEVSCECYSVGGKGLS